MAKEIEEKIFFYSKSAPHGSDTCPLTRSADLVMIPRRNVSKPALVIELKFNNTADTAIDQIKRKQYPAKIAEYTGDILLVGINYDKEAKKHTCKIERIRNGVYNC